MGVLNTTFPIGRLFGITIRIHVLFLIWIGYQLLQAGGAWRFEAAQTAMVFGIVLVHEFGHCFGARSVGGDARNILLWPLGGLAYAEAPMTPWAQFVTIAAGPIVHPLFCALSAAVLIATTGQVGVVSPNPFAAPRWEYFQAEWQVYVWLFYRINVALLCFNLLPIFPFDGGQLFRALLWPWLGLHRATIIATQVGLVGAIGLGVLGAWLSDWMLLAIAFFFGSTCWQHLQAARAGMRTEAFLSADHVLREKRNLPGFWSRLFRGPRRAGAPGRPIEFPNPNPGGWEAREAERRATEAELDRLLKKVSAHGIHSLSYVERQTLERITRERQREEREFQRDTRV